jgi:hypothetical protein
MSTRDKLISGPLGFGSAPLGNMFRSIPEAEAVAIVDAAWQQGIRTVPKGMKRGSYRVNTAPPSCATGTRSSGRWRAGRSPGTRGTSGSRSRPRRTTPGGRCPTTP